MLLQSLSSDFNDDWYTYPKCISDLPRTGQVFSRDIMREGS